jgi:hypothetical protein
MSKASEILNRSDEARPLNRQEISLHPPPVDPALGLPASFTLACYRFSLEALETLQLPPFKGSAIRGSLGYAFKRLVCAETCDTTCRRGNGCPYGYIFETSPPQGAEVLRTFSEVPRPFIIRAPTDRRTRIKPGERLHFDLTLVGQGLNYLPYFIAVFRELGRAGLGRNRGRYRLSRVEAVAPWSGATELVFQAGSELIRNVDLTLTAALIANHSARSFPPLPANSESPNQPTGQALTLNFLTPTRLKQQKQWVRRGPPSIPPAGGDAGSSPSRGRLGGGLFSQERELFNFPIWCLACSPQMRKLFKP